MSCKVKTIALTLCLCALLALAAGCGEEKLERSIIGEWRSGEGYIMSFDGSVMRFCDAEGNDLLGVGELEYSWDGEVLNVDMNGYSVDLFYTVIFGDTLRLSYTEPVLEHYDVEAAERIELTRVTR